MNKGYKEYAVAIEGTAPIVMHNGQTADPLNGYAKALKQVSGKRKKVDADHEKMAEIEWEAGLYLDHSEARKVIISGHVIEACIVSGAKRSKEGQVAKTALFVEGDAEFFVNGKAVSLDQIKGKEEFRLAVPVKVSTSRVVRTRPKFSHWSAKFNVQVMDNVANQSSVEGWIRDAGLYVGLCDWRPRYGRFTLKEFKPV